MKKINRLLANEDFKSVINKKKFFSNQSFSLYYAKNDIGHLRAGISISRKFGCAVLRNRAKRQVRMMITQIFDIHSCIDVVLMIRKGYQDRDYQTNKLELTYLYEKIKKRGELSE